MLETNLIVVFALVTTMCNISVSKRFFKSCLYLDVVIKQEHRSQPSLFFFPGRHLANYVVDWQVGCFALAGLFVWVDEQVRALRVAKRLQQEDRHLIVLCRAEPPPSWVHPDCSVAHFLAAARFPREVCEFFLHE